MKDPSLRKAISVNWNVNDLASLCSKPTYVENLDVNQIFFMLERNYTKLGKINTCTFSWYIYTAKNGILMSNLPSE